MKKLGVIVLIVYFAALFVALHAIKLLITLAYIVVTIILLFGFGLLMRSIVRGLWKDKN